MSKTKIDNINLLFSKVIDKKDFFKKASEQFKVAESSIGTNWFSKGKFPKFYMFQDNLIIFMQNYIFNQNLKK